MQNIRIKLDVEQWNNACKYLKDPAAGLDVAEESAIEQLSDFWRTQVFSKDLSDDCAELLEALKKNLKLYSSNNRKTTEQLQNYIGIAKKIYCTDKATYDEYVLALREFHNVRKAPKPTPTAPPQKKVPVNPTPVKSELKIVSVDFYDSDGDSNKYGLTLPTTVHYLCPRVKYTITPAPKTPIKVSYRIFSPSGEMEKSDSNPDGFLDSKVLTSRDGTIDFAGWGNTTGTAYYEGRWRFELYSESKLINTTYVEIKSPFSHVPPSIDIQKVEFANTDYDGGILNDYGSELPQSTRYLTPRIFFTVRNKENRQIELRYIIYGPNGTPIKNSSRNDRYTVSSRLNLASNSPATLSGFGNREGNSYLPGRYKVEIYEGDHLLYTTYVNIGKPQQPIYTPPPTPTSTNTTDKSSGGCLVTLILTAVVIAVIFGLMKWCERDNSEEDERTYIGVCQITSNGVNLRHGPGTEYDKIGVVSSGESYQLLEESGDWVKIEYDGSPAWLSSRFCSITYASDVEHQMEEATTPGARSSDSKNQNIDSQSRRTSEDQRQPDFYEQVSPQSNTASPTEVLESPVQVVREEATTPASVVSELEDDNVYNAAEQQAEFPGGMTALMKWLSANIRYPESAQQNNVQGRVLVKFIVEKDGSITNAQVIRSVDSDLDREALRVVSKMPKWMPGKNGGMPVRSYFTLPVSFRLQEQ